MLEFVFRVRKYFPKYCTFPFGEFSQSGGMILQFLGKFSFLTKWLKWTDNFILLTLSLFRSCNLSGKFTTQTKQWKSAAQPQPPHWPGLGGPRSQRVARDGGEDHDLWPEGHHRGALPRDLPDTAGHTAQPRMEQLQQVRDQVSSEGDRGQMTPSVLLS